MLLIKIKLEIAVLIIWFNKLGAEHPRTTSPVIKMGLEYLFKT
jgi:hypothetical protein